MAYNNFTLDMLIQQFGLRIVVNANTFAEAVPITPSALLQETITKFLSLALQIGTDKARAEFITAPVLADVWRPLQKTVSLFSGVDFTVDCEAGLFGVCDYLFSMSPLQLIMEAPAVAIVEANNENIKDGLAQCIAQMLAAQRFNAGCGTATPAIYGCVTSGSAWRFLRLCGNEVVVDNAEYHIGQLETILGILVFMVREALERQEGAI